MWRRQRLLQAWRRDKALRVAFHRWKLVAAAAAAAAALQQRSLGEEGRRAMELADEVKAEVWYLGMATSKAFRAWKTVVTRRQSMRAARAADALAGNLQAEAVRAEDVNAASSSSSRVRDSKAMWSASEFRACAADALVGDLQAEAVRAEDVDAASSVSSRVKGSKGMGSRSVVRDQWKSWMNEHDSRDVRERTFTQAKEEEAEEQGRTSAAARVVRCRHEARLLASAFHSWWAALTHTSPVMQSQPGPSTEASPITAAQHSLQHPPVQHLPSPSPPHHRGQLPRVAEHSETPHQACSSHGPCPVISPEATETITIADGVWQRWHLKRALKQWALVVHEARKLMADEARKLMADKARKLMADKARKLLADEARKLMTDDARKLKTDETRKLMTDESQGSKPSQSRQSNQSHNYPSLPSHTLPNKAAQAERFGGIEARPHPPPRHSSLSPTTLAAALQARDVNANGNTNGNTNGSSQANSSETRLDRHKRQQVPRVFLPVMATVLPTPHQVEERPVAAVTSHQAAAAATSYQAEERPVAAVPRPEAQSPSALEAFASTTRLAWEAPPSPRSTSPIPYSHPGREPLRQPDQLEDPPSKASKHHNLPQAATPRDLFRRGGPLMRAMYHAWRDQARENRLVRQAREATWRRRISSSLHLWHVMSHKSTALWELSEQALSHCTQRSLTGALGTWMSQCRLSSLCAERSASADGLLKKKLRRHLRHWRSTALSLRIQDQTVSMAEALHHYKGMKKAFRRLWHCRLKEVKRKRQQMLAKTERVVQRWQERAVFLSKVRHLQERLQQCRKQRLLTQSFGGWAAITAAGASVRTAAQLTQETKRHRAVEDAFLAWMDLSLLKGLRVSQALVVRQKRRKRILSSSMRTWRHAYWSVRMGRRSTLSHCFTRWSSATEMAIRASNAQEAAEDFRWKRDALKGQGALQQYARATKKAKTACRRGQRFWKVKTALGAVQGWHDLTLQSSDMAYCSDRYVASAGLNGLRRWKKRVREGKDAAERSLEVLYFKAWGPFTRWREAVAGVARLGLARQTHARRLMAKGLHEWRVSSRVSAVEARWARLQERKGLADAWKQWQRSYLPQRRKAHQHDRVVRETQQHKGLSRWLDLMVQRSTLEARKQRCRNDCLSTSLARWISRVQDLQQQRYSDLLADGSDFRQRRAIIRWSKWTKKERHSRARPIDMWLFLYARAFGRWRRTTQVARAVVLSSSFGHWKGATRFLEPTLLRLQQWKNAKLLQSCLKEWHRDVYGPNDMTHALGLVVGLIRRLALLNTTFKAWQQYTRRASWQQQQAESVSQLLIRSAWDTWVINWKGISQRRHMSLAAGLKALKQHRLCSITVTRARQHYCTSLAAKSFAAWKQLVLSTLSPAAQDALLKLELAYQEASRRYRVNCTHTQRLAFNALLQARQDASRLDAAERHCRLRAAGGALNRWCDRITETKRDDQLKRKTITALSYWVAASHRRSATMANFSLGQSLHHWHKTSREALARRLVMKQADLVQLRCCSHLIATAFRGWQGVLAERRREDLLEAKALAAERSRDGRVMQKGFKAWKQHCQALSSAKLLVTAMRTIRLGMAWRSWSTSALELRSAYHHNTWLTRKSLVGLSRHAAEMKHDRQLRELKRAMSRWHHASQQQQRLRSSIVEGVRSAAITESIALEALARSGIQQWCRLAFANASARDAPRVRAAIVARRSIRKWWAWQTHRRSTRLQCDIAEEHWRRRGGQGCLGRWWAKARSMNWVKSPRLARLALQGQGTETDEESDPESEAPAATSASSSILSTIEAATCSDDDDRGSAP
ncbi:unnamed protein product [Chrysoparadoxa australica]